MSRRRIAVPIFVSILFLAIVAVISVPVLSADVRWRLGVIALKASGKLEGLGWSDLLPMLKPGSGFWLMPLLESPNPYAVIHNPRTAQSDIQTGRDLFRSRCESCHGAGASGGMAPPLVARRLKHGSSDWALFKTIRGGVSGTAMQPHDYPAADLWRLVAYVQDRVTTRGEDDATQSNALTLRPLAVPFDELRKARSPSADWPTYYGSYNGYRFSSLTNVNRSNVWQLQARWIHQLSSRGARIETTPLAAGGRLFLTDPEGGVIALDGASGKLLWRYSSSLPSDVSLCCNSVNRGVAVLGDRVFVATLGAHLVALDGTSGRVIWDQVITDYREGYSSTGAPLVVKNMVITGIAGAEFGAPGFISAFDAATGKMLWRFDTIPKPGEKGNQTWEEGSWRTGGVSTWMTGTYDPELDLIYWGTANPAPAFDASARAGDNLYSNSVIALKADSGQLAWYFQYTPGDDHDWDSMQVPVLADVIDGSETRKLLLTANRNGFFYALDRTTGKFLRAVPYVKQTWAERIDSNGRPVRRPGTSGSEQGVLVYPGTPGGTNWWPPTFSPLAQLFIVPALERPSVFFRTPAERRKGEQFLGGTSMGAAATHFTAVRALDPRTGALRWERRSAPRYDTAEQSGLLSTAGGLVFASDRAKLLALDIDDGRELFSLEAGGAINSPPSTYIAGSEQFLAFAAGDVVIGMALPRPLADSAARGQQPAPGNRGGRRSGPRPSTRPKPG